ncbi:MAG: calcium/sodium antiporter [Planctomycetes bacterium]|nr:calcium/sodium antiporter [Planctomycetota bacterium]
MLGIILLVVGLCLVVKGADWLVDGASSLARRLGVSDLAIGLTVVAFGTSLPELTVNIFAVVQNQPSVAVGNITGSNICNILLILGISSLLCPLRVQRSTTWKEIPFSLLAQVLLWIMLLDKFLDGAAGDTLSRTDGLSLLAMFIIFMAYIVGMAKNLHQSDEQDKAKILTLGKSLFLVLLGLGFLIAGGKLVVDGALRLADWLGLSKSFIAVTVVAVGTSIPELATSAVAAYKKKADIAVGNVVGSNIFNILLILGISSTLRPIPMPADLYLSVYAGIFATIVLFTTLFVGKRHTIGRWEGMGMLGLYILYLILQPK